MTSMTMILNNKIRKEEKQIKINHKRKIYNKKNHNLSTKSDIIGNQSFMYATEDQFTVYTTEIEN